MAQSITLNVTLAQAAKGEELPATTAYAFDDKGTLIGQADVVDGVAQLQTKGAAKVAQVLVGALPPSPDPSAPAPEPTLEALTKANAFPVTGRLGSKLSVVVPRPSWFPWHWHFCQVRGHVVKPWHIGPFTFNLPVCEATVHIYEVDRLPWIIDRIPDVDITRLGRELVATLGQPVPPIPDPGPLLERVALPRLATHVMPAMGAGADAAVTRAIGIAPVRPLAAAAAATPTAALTRDLSAAIAAPAIPLTVHTGLTSPAVDSVRATLKANMDLLIPNLRLFPWIWGWFTPPEIGTAVTDDDGAFSHWMFVNDLGDQPDLYFAVEANVGGFVDWVYRPSVPCTTWWDYPCGTDVVLRVTDPRVSGCFHRPPETGLTVKLRGVGDLTSVGQIGRASDGAHQGKLWADSLYGAPYAGLESVFASTIDLRVDFGNRLTPAGITHYAWSYRRFGSTSEADWVKMSAAVSRHYDTNAVPSEQKIVQIGPDPSVSGVFTPITPPTPADWLQWHGRSTRIDEASAYFETTTVAVPPLPTGPDPDAPHGLFELKLELFRNVAGTMTRVDFTTEGVRTFEVDQPGPLVGNVSSTEIFGTTPADQDRLLLDAGGHVVGMRLVVAVDNRPCTADIEDVQVDGALAGECGFLEYGPNSSARLAFHAAQPDNLGYVSYGTIRVAADLPVGDTAFGLGLLPSNAFVAAGGNEYTKSVPIGDMFAGTTCTRAAFVNNVRVDATATDGYTRAYWLDAGTYLKAFAITPA